MSSEHIPTDPEFRQAPWRPVPSRIEQALEAARDDPSECEFINMLCSLEVGFVDVSGRDEDWRPTSVSVSGVASARTGDVVTIARRAGWELTGVTFERERLTFEPRECC
ncbi:hypothetical protein [Halomontanus rarus]|uniref:hypothetical protein n=1 Tax=Halomontanus rarus TaxID=3034020 RepID=UPI00307CAC66